MRVKDKKLTFWEVVAILAVIAYGVGIMYVGWQNNIKIVSLEKIVEETADINVLKKENKDLKMDLTSKATFLEQCHENRKDQWIALSLWRSGYLTQKCEDSRSLLIEFELNLASEIHTYPEEFKEELDIINSLNNVDFLRDQCMRDLEETNIELNIVYERIQAKEDPEGFEELLRNGSRNTERKS